jgi:glutamine synthetase
MIAAHSMTADKNLALFEKMGVFTKEECTARQDVLHDHYTGTVEMEALCLSDMIAQHVIPSVKKAGAGPLAELEAIVPKLAAAVAEIHAAETPYEKASLARVLRLETMIEMREVCDAAEGVVPAEDWTLATYKELLFLDSHTATTDAGDFDYE